MGPVWVRLTCEACGSYAYVLATGRVCRSHAHFRTEGGQVEAWVASHFLPELEVVALLPAEEPGR